MTIIIPFYLLATTALKTTNELYTNPLGLPADPQWQNFAVAIKDGNIMAYALNSVLVTGVSVVLIMLLQTLCAYGIYRIYDKPLGKVLYNICIGGMMIPAVGYAS
jgi:raffinose/stachyose/melibiose transport system permease protein